MVINGCIENLIVNSENILSDMQEEINFIEKIPSKERGEKDKELLKFLKKHYKELRKYLDAIKIEYGFIRKEKID